MAALLTVVLFLVTVVAGSEAAAVEAAGEDRIQILGVEQTADAVALEIAVPPAIGRLAPIGANFGVTDGGELVQVDVRRLEPAIDTVIVLDTSGSMTGSALAAAKDAARSFIAALPADARVGLIGFGDEVTTHREPTTDRAALLDDLDGLDALGQETVLWDALLVAADLVAAAEPGRSSVVVLSDGDDTASAATPAAVARGFATGTTPLYAVAIESPDTDLDALEAVVGQVSGQFLATSDIGQLETLYTDIAGRLSNRYLLRFAPIRDGERTVVVSVAAGETIATARTVIGDAPPITGPGPAPADDGPAGALPPVLNLGEDAVLGAVEQPTLGWLAGEPALALGLISMFAAFVLAGLLLAAPSNQVRLDAAAGADRIGGINARLGLAVDRVITRHDQGRRIDTRLEAADISLRPGEFALALLVASSVAGLGVLFVAGAALALLVVGAIVLSAYLVLSVRANRRRSQFAEQLTETLSIMAGSLRAGQSLPQAIELVAAEAPSPTAEQFHRVAFEIRVGRDLTDSIRDAAARMASPDLEWLAQAVDINRELGGDLSEVMDNVASTIRERRTIARQIDALSSEGRATAWVLLAMPVLLFLFSWWRTPDNIETLVGEPIGRVLLGVALSGMVLGHFWIRHLVRLKY